MFYSSNWAVAALSLNAVVEAAPWARYTPTLYAWVPAAAASLGVAASRQW